MMLALSISMRSQSKKPMAVFLLFFGVILLRGQLFADSSAEEQCEKLHTEALKKAKQALSDGKTDEALRFLLEAEAISTRCARLLEPESPRGQEENVLASAPSGKSGFSASAPR